MVTYFVLCTTWKTRTLSNSVMPRRRRALGLRPATRRFDLHDVVTARCGKEGTAGPAADYAVNLPP